MINTYNGPSKLSYVLFADDTNIFATGKTPSEIINVLNTALVDINNWIKSNMLSLNLSKTNYMIMSSPGKRIKVDDSKIQIEGHDINRVESTTFLGVVIDDKMSWKL